jgi:serine/threonine protein kinase/WD40 repeat protein
MSDDSQKDNPAPVESSGDDAMGAVLESFLVRFRKGERPPLDEFIQRYPALADEIREVLPAIVEVERLGSVGGPASEAGSRGGMPSPSGTVELRSEPGAAAAGETAIPGPQRLGDYRILRTIGEGGMGVVYEAERESLKSRVALKVIHARFRTSKNYLRRFRTEARSAAQLHHTNIVSVFDYGEHDGVCYYAMQYIAGHSLDHVLADVRQIRLRKDGKEVEPLLPPGEDTDAQVGAGEIDDHGPPHCLTEAEAPDHLLGRTITQGLLTGRYSHPSLASQDRREDSQAATAELGFELRQPKAARAVAPFQTEDSAIVGDKGPSSSSLADKTEDRYFREVAKLGAQAADALDYAHRRNVVHRDIKPSNLLLDAVGNVWVTDFGLAKFVEGEDVSRSRDIVGTLRYMGPERFQGVSDPRCDIYALGATLYEMVALRPAFDGDDQVRLIDQIVHEPPVPPRQIDRSIPRDLEVIIQKALAKDPKDRFRTAGELADELRRFIENRPIRSRPIPASERLWRWCKRNPLLASLNALAATLTTAIAIVSTVAAIHLERSNTAVKFALERVKSAELERTAQLREANVAQARAGRFSRQVGQRFESLAALKKATALGIRPERRLELRNEAIAALALPDVRLEKTLEVWDGKDTGEGGWIAFDGAFDHFAYSDREGAVTLRRVDDRVVIARRPGPGWRPARVGLGFSPDGRWLITQCYSGGYGRASPAVAWEIRDSKQGRTVSLSDGDSRWCGFGPDGSAAAILHSDNSIAFVDPSSGQEGRRVRLHLEPRRLSSEVDPQFSPDGRWIAVHLAGSPSVYLFDPDTGEEVRRLDHPEEPYSSSWSRDGRLLAAACNDRQIYVWEAGTGRLISVLEGHHGAGVVVQFSHSSDFLTSRSWDGTSRLWDPIRGWELLRIPAHLAALSTDDRHMALIAPNGQFEVWEVAPGRECHILHPGLIGNRSPRFSYGTGGVDFRSDRRLLASDGNGARLWDLTSLTEIAHIPVGVLSGASFRPDGSSLLTYNGAGLRIWPIEIEPGAEDAPVRVGPSRLADLPRVSADTRASWSDDGRMVVATDLLRQQAVLIDPTSLIEIGRFGPHPRMRHAKLSPDGKWLATSTWGGSDVKVWDVARGVLAWELPCGSAIVAFSPDGRWLVTALDHEYRLWRVGNWRAGIEIRSNNRFNTNFAFTRDSRILAVDRGGIILLVDPGSGSELAKLEPPPEANRNVGRLAFSPDSNRLAVPADQEILVWDLRLIRGQLAELGLDWETPPSSTADAIEAPPSLDVRVEGVDWFAAAFEGRDHAWEGRWDQALAAYTRALDLGADDPVVWGRQLTLRLRAGDPAGYRSGCKALLARFGQDRRPGMVQPAAWACALGPDAPADWSALVRSVDEAVARFPKDAELRTTLGAVLFRAGRFRQAIRNLEESIRLNRYGGNAYDWLFLAMARHRLGDHAAARAALATARDWIAHGDERAKPDPWVWSPLPWFTRLELGVLAREAGALIDGPTVELPADVFAPR